MIQKKPFDPPRIHHAIHGEHRLFTSVVDSAYEHTRASVHIFDPGEDIAIGTLRSNLPECRVFLHQHLENALEVFLRTEVDVVLLAYSQQHPTLDLLTRFKVGKPSVPIIVLAESGSESLAIDVFRRGARDYFRKPLELDELSWTLRILLNIRQTDFGRTSTTGLSSFEKALQFIQLHYRSSLSLQQVAEKSGMSLSSFVRRFKKKTGMTFVDYVNSMRISSACSLLRNPDLSLLQISLACGYSNQCHFNRTFKKLIGLTPGQYRKSLKNIH